MMGFIADKIAIYDGIKDKCLSLKSNVISDC